MTIRKKPLSIKEEIKINEIIEKGGSTCANVEKALDISYRLTLRIPSPLKTKIDEVIKQDPTCPSLTSWILEAIKQRLQIEKNKETF